MQTEKKILIVDSYTPLREVVVSIFESFFNVEIYEATSANDAIEIIKNTTTPFSLVISDYKFKNDTAKDLHGFIQSSKSEIPFFLITAFSLNELPYFKNLEKGLKNNQENQTFLYMSKPFDINIVLEKVEKILNIKPKLKDSFLEIKIETFLKHWLKTSIDVYLKLGEEKKVKIFRDGNFTKDEILNKYVEKGIQYFYIKTDQAEDIAANLLKNINQKLDKNFQENIYGTDNTNSKLIADVHLILKVLGINSKTITVLNRTIDQCIKSFEKDSQLSSLIDNFKNKSDFITSHAYLCAYLSNHLVQKFSWHTKDSIRKFTAASLFQDLSLDYDSQSNFLGNLNDLELELNEKDIIIEHPRRSAEMISQNELFGKEVYELILTHHERPDGRGFPQALVSSHVRQMQALFILVSDFSRFALLSDSSTLKASIVNFMKKYETGNYKVICKEFLRLFV